MDICRIPEFWKKAEIIYLFSLLWTVRFSMFSWHNIFYVQSPLLFQPLTTGTIILYLIFPHLYLIFPSKGFSAKGFQCAHSIVFWCRKLAHAHSLVVHLNSLPKLGRTRWRCMMFPQIYGLQVYTQGFHTWAACPGHAAHVLQYLVPGTWYQVPVTLYLIYGTWHQVPVTW